jgi:hypothetical protein
MSAVFAASGGSLQVLLSSPGLVAYAVCLTLFLFEYCYFEVRVPVHTHTLTRTHTCSRTQEVHTYTYDLFRERIGFKLVWGCTCFYPFFYCIGVYPLVNPNASSLSPSVALACCLLYVFGWVLTRGASEYHVDECSRPAVETSVTCLHALFQTSKSLRARHARRISSLA